MCGRYCISEDTAGSIKKIVQELDEGLAVYHPGDVYPSNMATVLVRMGKTVGAEDMKWGFPGYDGKSLLINARAEGALEKKTFQDSMYFRRCVIPASAFYEWNKRKEKFTFQRKREDDLLYMAGCFNIYEGQNCFVILTTQANASMAPVHDRMPLLLEQEEIWDWLAPESAVEQLLGKVPPLLERSTEYEQLSLF